MSYGHCWVNWSLEYKCLHRGTAKHWQSPRNTSKELFELEIAAYSDIFEGYCLYDPIGVPDGKGQVHSVPRFAFPLGEALLNDLGSVCEACPINIAPKDGVAGCHGCLQSEASSKELDDWVEKRLHAEALVRDFDTNFLQTRPRWYGLWADSPLSHVQRNLLTRLLATSEIPGVEHFLQALRSTQPLFVQLMPPSHSGFGATTIFPHCDRCQAMPDLKRDLHQTQSCHVCGNHYIPRNQQEQIQMWTPDPLKRLLGEKTKEFLSRYLSERELDASTITEIVTNYEKRVSTSVPKQP